MSKDPGQAAARPVQTDSGRQFRVCYDFKLMSCGWQGLHIARQILYRNVEGLLPLFPVQGEEHTDDDIIHQYILIMAF